MCGGCRGEGGFSSRCSSQPGGLWRRLSDEAKCLGDSIGSNDPEMSNQAYRMAGHFMTKWEEAVERAKQTSH